MKLSEIARALDPTRWAMLAGAVALLIVAVFVIGRCSGDDETRQAKNDATMAQGRTTSAVEAITEIGKLEDRGQATDTQVEEATNAIRQAAPADRDAVARAHLCRLQHRPDCDRML